MLTFEQFGHTFKSARSIIQECFFEVDTDEIVFNEVDGKLHVIIFINGTDLNTKSFDDALKILQMPENLGDSIDVEEFKKDSYIKMVIDEKILETRRK